MSSDFDRCNYMAAPLELQIICSTAAPRNVTLSPAAESEPIVIGSDPMHGMCVGGEGVAPIHAELFCDGDFWCLRDRASAGGTYLDGNRLFITAIRLEVGHTIRLGMGEAATILNVLAGAAAAREGANIAVEVAGYVRAQRADRRRRLGWKIALPSAGLIAIVALWGVGALVVAADKSDRLAHPERYAFEDETGATGRLASIMAGEARPEDVDVKEIIAAASFGRSSKVVDAALGTIRRIDSVAEGSQGVRPRAIRTQAARPGHSSTPVAKAVDEATVAELIAQRAIAEGPKRAALDARLIEESRIVTVRRLGKLLEARRALSEPSPAGPPSRKVQNDLMLLDDRLKQLGIDPVDLNWKPGDDLEPKIDPQVLEQIRVRLVEALAGR